MSWSDAIDLGQGTVERQFRIVRPGGVVPGVVWLPATAPPWPLVLLGHGGSGHKRSERNVGFGRWFSAQAGLAVVAIDGPYHGERVSEPLAASVYQRLMLDEGLEVVSERMVEDWRAAIDAVGSLGAADPTRVGYFGLSMGTRFGVPLAASLGTDLSCAVLGKFGLSAARDFYDDADSTTIVKQAATGVTAPTMFHVQLDDELFPRDGQVTLFDALAACDKLLLACPGAHADSPPAATALWRSFIVDHLRPTDPPHTSAAAP